MRYSEIADLQGVTLEEAMINEAFLNDLAKMVGNKAKQQVTVVNNTMTAAQVLYRVCSNQSYLESMTFELKRAIKNKLKNLPDGRLRKAIISKFPQGRGLKDFFTSLALVAVMNSVEAGKDLLKDQAMNTIINNVVNIDALIGHMLSAGSGALGAVFKALGVGNTVLFSILTSINGKLESVKTQDAQKTMSTPQVSLNKAA